MGVEDGGKGERRGGIEDGRADRDGGAEPCIGGSRGEGEEGGNKDECCAADKHGQIEATKRRKRQTAKGATVCDFCFKGACKQRFWLAKRKKETKMRKRSIEHDNWLTVSWNEL